jgi:hypothetical protein
MIMSKPPRKLTLTRETLLPLNNAELSGINGGTSPAISVSIRVTVAVTAAACLPVSNATLMQAQQSFGGVYNAVDTAKKAGKAAGKFFHQLSQGAAHAAFHR